MARLVLFVCLKLTMKMKRVLKLFTPGVPGTVYFIFPPLFFSTTKLFVCRGRHSILIGAWDPMVLGRPLAEASYTLRVSVEGSGPSGINKLSCPQRSYQVHMDTHAYYSLVASFFFFVACCPGSLPRTGFHIF